MDPKDDKAGTPPQGEPDPKPGDTVAYETHRRLLDQRKKDQERLAAAEAERDRLRTAAEEAERKRLEEAAAYKDLYEKERKERETKDKLLKDRDEADKLASKRNALKSELGGAVKDEYLAFANLAAIPLGADGQPDAQAVKDVAEKFRKEHPSLIGKGASLPGGAASGFTPPASKPLNKLTADEALALYRQQRAAGKISL
jgi:seryl-tRNA synthetase